MKVFISWSGTGSKSHLLAEALNDWIPTVLQATTTFMSSAALEAGERWQTGLSKVLEECDFGIACLTPKHLHADWILFECGALAKRVDRARLIPLLCDLNERDMAQHPLTMFNYVKLDKPGVRKVIETINANLKDHKLPNDKLSQVFEKWWPDLEQQLKKVHDATDEQPKKKIDVDTSLEEILSLLRSLDRRLNEANKTDEALAQLRALSADARFIDEHFAKRLANRESQMRAIALLNELGSVWTTPPPNKLVKKAPKPK